MTPEELAAYRQGITDASKIVADHAKWIGEAKALGRTVDVETALRNIAMAISPTAFEAPSNACSACEGGGWLQVYSDSPPAFEVCPICFNPEGNPCP